VQARQHSSNHDAAAQQQAKGEQARLLGKDELLDDLVEPAAHRNTQQERSSHH
jgi:hypothetical protein